jgi:hypothetical protein
MRPELASDWTDGRTGDWQAPGDYPDTSPTMSSHRLKTRLS